MVPDQISPIVPDPNDDDLTSGDGDDDIVENLKNVLGGMDHPGIGFVSDPEQLDALEELIRMRVEKFYGEPEDASLVKVTFVDTHVDYYDLSTYIGYSSYITLVQDLVTKGDADSVRKLQEIFVIEADISDANTERLKVITEVINNQHDLRNQLIFHFKEGGLVDLREEDIAEVDSLLAESGPDMKVAGVLLGHHADLRPGLVDYRDFTLMGVLHIDMIVASLLDKYQQAEMSYEYFKEQLKFTLDNISRYLGEDQSNAVKEKFTQNFKGSVSNNE